jgi:hypothetical protein
MAFNFLRLKEVAPEAIERVLETQYEVARPMGNVAASQISDAIWISLVGFFKEISAIISRRNEWLDRAIQEDEEFGQNREFHRVTLYRARALGEWMQTGHSNEVFWNKSRLHQEGAFQYWTDGEIRRDGLNDYMAFAYLSGNKNDGAEAGISMYERWLGIKDVSLKKPMTPRGFGYALCLHLARQQFDKNDLFNAGRKMLQSHLDENWLGRGQYARAAMWLKIVYWINDAALTPIQVCLRHTKICRIQVT